MPHHDTPAAAWAELRAGNTRFIEDKMEHPSQGFDRREQLKVAQHPFAVVFGCSDSRVAAEIIFDQGLGDVFVVRTAGHVVDTTVIGSIEYGVDVLDTRLVVVLGHDSCGAVAAAGLGSVPAPCIFPTQSATATPATFASLLRAVSTPSSQDVRCAATLSVRACIPAFTSSSVAMSFP